MLGNTRMFRTVQSSVHAYKDDKPFDLRLMREEQAKKAALESSYAYNRSFLKEVEEDEKNKLAMESLSRASNIAIMKTQAYNNIERMIPDYVISEAFARIYIDSLPHDGDFIVENYNALANMATFYIRKLGGAEYFKQKVLETHSPFLKKIYDVCMETAKKIKANKKKKVANAMTENEVKEMIMPKINDEERDQIINNINNLGTDELSDLVREKIINVVKDEHQREKEEREFRTVLKNDIQDPTLRMDTNEDNIGSKKVKKKGGSIDTGDDGVDMDPIEGDEIEDTKKDGSSKSSFKKSGSSKDTKTAKDNEDTQKAEDKKNKDDSGSTKSLLGDSEDKDDKKKDKDSAKESFGYINMDLQTAMERWNPFTQDFQYSEDSRPRTLLFAITASVTRDLMNQKLAYENSEYKVEKKPVSETLIRNPLNLEIFNAYLKSNNRALDTIIQSTLSEPETYATTDPGMIDKDRILTEALVQYGLFETAYTMRLINPTQNQIKEQSEFLLHGA